MSINIYILHISSFIFKLQNRIIFKITKLNMITSVKSKKRPSLFINFPLWQISGSLPFFENLPCTTNFASWYDFAAVKLFYQRHGWIIILLEPLWWNFHIMTCGYPSTNIISGHILHLGFISHSSLSPSSRTQSSRDHLTFMKFELSIYFISNIWICICITTSTVNTPHLCVNCEHPHGHTTVGRKCLL